MKTHWNLDPDLPVDTIMRRWPESIRVLIDHKMLCIGCPIAIFHTVTEACSLHDVDQVSFVEALKKVLPAEAGE